MGNLNIKVGEQTEPLLPTPAGRSCQHVIFRKLASWLSKPEPLTVCGTYLCCSCGSLLEVREDGSWVTLLPQSGPQE